jgi:hypothetical protein
MSIKDLQGGRMTREIALHCMKSYSESHSDLCELCPIYGQTGSDHCFEDALEYVIKDLEQEPVIDKIRAEMFEEMQSHSGTGEEVIQAYADGIKKGLEILDKYKAESEDK